MAKFLCWLSELFNPSLKDIKVHVLEFSYQNGWHWCNDYFLFEDEKQFEHWYQYLLNLQKIDRGFRDRKLIKHDIEYMNPKKSERHVHPKTQEGGIGYRYRYYDGSSIQPAKGGFTVSRYVYKNI